LASITGKRLSLHKYVKEQKQENDALKYQLAQIQHLANTGTISFMIAHEINNLLTPLRNYAAVALENPDDKTFVEKALHKTVRNCERASNIMESMLALSNGQTQEKKNARLLALVEEIFTSRRIDRLVRAGPDSAGYNEFGSQCPRCNAAAWWYFMY